MSAAYTMVYSESFPYTSKVLKVYRALRAFVPSQTSTCYKHLQCTLGLITLASSTHNQDVVILKLP